MDTKPNCFRELKGIKVMLLTPLSSYFVIVTINFIGGGNRSIQRKPPTCRESLPNVIT